MRPAPNLRIEYFQKRNGAQLAYAATGSGSPVLVIPPWVFDMEMSHSLVAPMIDRLRLDHRVLFYDKQGTGLSDRELDDWRFERHVEELIEVLDHLEVERTSLWACSQAGPIALALAAAHPERVSRIVFVSTYANGPAIFRRADVRESMLAMVRAHWGMGSKVLADMLAPNATSEESQQLAADQRRATSAEVAARALEELYSVDMSDRLAAIRAPSLVLQHAQDRAIPFSGGQQLASGIADSRLITLDGLGHALLEPASEPDVIDEVIEFFRGASESAAERSPLTGREVEVLRLVAEGYSNQEIADRLTISQNTVANHLRNILDKTKARNRAAAASYAVRAGLV
jgi:pimeloyl-ACP methyl ester carboxylesterase/DNA-binding CsgD family transcriptional regulator